MPRRATASVLIAVTLAGLLALSASALATQRRGNSVKLTAPATVAPGYGFTVRVYGFASPPASSLALFTASAKARCPNTYRGAIAVAKSAGGLLLHPGKHGRAFSFNTGFMATQAGVNFICAYVINRYTTYAHAGIHYTTP